MKGPPQSFDEPLSHPEREKIEELSAAAFCQVIDSVNPDSVSLSPRISARYSNSSR
jgi:hypothetical protein